MCLHIQFYMGMLYILSLVELDGIVSTLKGKKTRNEVHVSLHVASRIFVTIIHNETCTCLIPVGSPLLFIYLLFRILQSASVFC